MHGVVLAVLLQATMAGGEHDYKTAFQSADETGKPLLVLVGTNWCPGCVTMKRSVMPSLLRKGKLTGVAYAEVDADSDSGLAGKLMQGGSIPQLILYRKTNTGWRRSLLVGAQSETTIETLVERAVEQQAALKKETAEQAVVTASHVEEAAAE
ncbi:thioredoxin family protein [Blastopirellula sp. JC732]|uniref:Thioredoxin family protein n=1 Tax=Blastopirellula sediminis TaxID=2894196 RepID=A0A9X1MT13_9BACT|nr:thioredoxin family protein [Blastopirellula sediminis]MCC9604465.1 thioredoxin family protein [Blastopirellula sediminis]MCC9632236.1 thioredoxin family protein [Blastopirellula sediminis]